MGRPGPVLLIHGIDDTEALFQRIRPCIERSGRVVQCLNLSPNNGAAALDVLARQVDRFVQTTFGDREPIDVVAFSMGGLVARYYVQRLGGIARTKRLITISSPHKGTFTAYLRGNEGARQMRPGSAFLRDLNGDARVLQGIEFTSIWTPFDLMIVPAYSSVLPIGRAIRVSVIAHPLMVGSRRVLKLVLDQLNAEHEALSPSPKSEISRLST